MSTLSRDLKWVERLEFLQIVFIYVAIILLHQCLSLMIPKNELQGSGLGKTLGIVFLGSTHENVTYNMSAIVSGHNGSIMCMALRNTPQ